MVNDEIFFMSAQNHWLNCHFLEIYQDPSEQ